MMLISDINLHEPKGFMEIKIVVVATKYRIGPNYDLTEDGRSFYIQQNLASPAFLVSTDQYDFLF